MIVGNQYNLKDTRTVLKAEAYEFSDTSNILYYKVSAKKPFRVNKSFYNLTWQLIGEGSDIKNSQHRKYTIL